MNSPFHTGRSSTILCHSLFCKTRVSLKCVDIPVRIGIDIDVGITSSQTACPVRQNWPFIIGTLNNKSIKTISTIT